jgi:anti-sigma B factor antagonist
MLQTFRVTAVTVDGACTLILSGDADLAVAPDIIELGTASLLETTTHSLLVDLTAVTFIDSTVVGAFVTLGNLAKGPDKKLVLVGPSTRVMRILELAGLQGVFNIV